MTPARYNRLRRVLDQRQPDLTVITDEVHMGRNLSAIMRTCDAVGVGQIHGVRPRRGFRSFRGTAMGSQKWVECQLHDQVQEPIAQLQAQGYQVVAAHLSDTAKDFREVDFTRPTALLLGTEKDGVSDQALAQVDQHITVPMLGMVESFNVSVAAAIILSEAQRQRHLAGAYDQVRLPHAEYQRLLFRWGHPAVTKFCDARALAYPELDEEGEIVDPSAWYQSIREAEQAAAEELQESAAEVIEG